MVNLDLRIIVLLFIAIDILEAAPEWKKFAEKLKTKGTKNTFVFGPNPSKNSH